MGDLKLLGLPIQPSGTGNMVLAKQGFAMRATRRSAGECVTLSSSMLGTWWMCWDNCGFPREWFTQAVLNTVKVFQGKVPC